MRKWKAAVASLFAALFIATMFAPPASATHYGFEFDIGKYTSSSPDSVYPRPVCAFNSYVSACLQEYGDIWWVKDLKADGRSAVVEWKNTVNGHLRKGACRNKSGAGTWVRCNKNYYEGSELAIRLCRFEGSSGTWGNYSTYKYNVSCTEWFYGGTA